MISRIRSARLRNLLLTAFILGLSSTALADHSVVLTLPTYQEEALTWCGPAAGQMAMEGYPAGSCAILQEDIWTGILTYKAEPMWDTDPVGLKEAIKHICPPIGTWSVFSNTDSATLMHSVAYWMTKNHYPAIVLLDTQPLAEYPAHAEHWVAVAGIVTDVDPTTSGTVNLKWVFYHDPTEDNALSIPKWVSGSVWYGLLLPAAKPASVYNGKYVAIVEPPVTPGRLIAHKLVLKGKIIPPEEALKYAADWIKEVKPYEREHYSLLRQAKPLTPLLVNKNYGGYYIIPYTSGENSKLAQAAVMINAYTGEFQELVVFKPTKFVPKEEAVKIALQNLGKEKAEHFDAELVLPLGEHAVNRQSPIWKVTVDNKVVGVSQTGKVFTKMPAEEFSIPLPGKKLEGIAWDGKQFWVLDGESKLYQVESQSGATTKTLDLKIENPKGLAFDGKLLWVADEQKKKIHAINPEEGQIVKSINMEIPMEKGFQSVAGLTWDGKNLWTAFYAGFSSTFNQIDMENGRIIKSVFADCHPRGIASDGEYLWSICYNTDKLSAKIDRRKILEKEHEMLRTRQFIKNIEGHDPLGLVYDGEFLWYADRRLKRVFKFYDGKLNEK